MRRFMILFLTILPVYMPASAQYYEQPRSKDTVELKYAGDTIRKGPRLLPDLLSPELFIPSDRLSGVTTWMSAPVARPEVHVIPVYGFSGYGFGRFTVDHFDRFFANLLGFNHFDVPQLVDNQQMMLGNTLSLGKKRRLFFTNGILYGRHFGTWGNMIGMGSREGLIFRPSGVLMITVWTQEYQSVYAYSPVVYPKPGEDPPAIKLPASPVMVSYGAQAYFLAGQFWIGVGASFWTPHFKK